MRMRSLFLFSIASAVVFAQDPVKVDPAHHRVLFENAHIRVVEYRDQPGYKAPMHSHPAYVRYEASPVKTKLILPNGQIKIHETKDSEAVCSPPTQHAAD
jgi:polyisoprenoid-binding protein YceI